MGPLQLAVTWYKIRHAGEQAVHSQDEKGSQLEKIGQRLQVLSAVVPNKNHLKRTKTCSSFNNSLKLFLLVLYEQCCPRGRLGIAVLKILE